MSIHTAKPTSGYPHRPLPISHLDSITTPELFHDFAKRSAQWKKVKFELAERIAKVEGWRARFQEICYYTLSRVQAFQRYYGEILRDKHQNLSTLVNTAIEDITHLMINSGYQHNSPLTTNCWQFITKQSSSFQLDVVIETWDPDRLMDWFAYHAEYLGSGLQELNIVRENSIVTELRAQLAASAV